MTFNGPSLIPWVVQGKSTQLFETVNDIHTVIIFEVFYSKNFNTPAQCLVLIVSDGTYFIPLLIDPEAVKDRFGPYLKGTRAGEYAKYSEYPTINEFTTIRNTQQSVNSQPLENTQQSVNTQKLLNTQQSVDDTHQPVNSQPLGSTQQSVGSLSSEGMQQLVMSLSIDNSQPLENTEKSVNKQHPTKAKQSVDTPQSINVERSVKVEPSVDILNPVDVQKSVDVQQAVNSLQPVNAQQLANIQDDTNNAPQSQHENSMISSPVAFMEDVIEDSPQTSSQITTRLNEDFFLSPPVQIWKCD
ncbi:hypothetical protein BD770DRAFT_473568 [Pilaira anomala]|nr:hypothetical protein BD770DRAFT_473568 [Pilaira anomala]